jgi:hypothetical protein
MPRDVDVLEITIQRGGGGVFPIVAEHHRPGALLPVRSEGVLELAAEPSNSIPHTYGVALGQAVFRGAIRDAFVRTRASQTDGMRILLFVEAAELKAWRWEWLCAPVDSTAWDFLSLDQRALYSIYLPSLTDRPLPPIGRRDLRALVLIANPADPENKYGLASFDVDQNVARLKSIFAERLPAEVLARVPGASGLPTLDALATELTTRSADRPYTILHLVCHGRYQPDGETILYLEQPSPGPVTGRLLADPVAGTDLIDRLRRVGRLPYLVFLSTCESAAPEAEQRLGGLAQRLVRDLGIPAVIGMTERVTIATAHALADEFYRRLLAQSDIGEVDRALVEAYAGLASRRDVNVPALYSRLGSQPLFSDMQDRPPNGAEISAGLENLDKLLIDRAPVLRPKLAEKAEELHRTLDTPPEALSVTARSEHDKVLADVNALCQEVVEISFHALAQGVRPPAYDSRQPFVGQSPFRSSHREFYFGRESLVRKLVKKLASDNFLAVLGPSGSGKSSLVLAGLVPWLKTNEPGIQIIDDFAPGSDPLEQLTLRQGWLAPGPVVYIVDQFEELFTVCKDEDQRKEFIDELLKLTQSDRVIITMRADFWGECARYPELKERMQARQELIGPMTSAELRSATEQQAAKVGLRFEADLSNTMLDEVVDEPGAMPLLQHALLELWKRRRGRWLRIKEYRDLGGVKKSIAETAERLYDSLAADERDRVRDIFLRLTRLDDNSQGEGKRHTRRRLSLSELVPAGSDPERTKGLVKRLADAALLVTSQGRVQGEVEIAHEALIRYWTRLQQWIEESSAIIRVRDSVRQASLEWESHDHSDDFLQHIGQRLETAAVLFKGQRLSLNSTEAAYLRSCAQKDRDLRLNPSLHNLQESGWGVIFPADTGSAECDALRPLLDHRQAQVAKRHPSRYREFRGDQAYRPGDTVFEFLTRQGLGVGQDDPERVPRVLLLAGSPQQIPFQTQYLLSQLGYAVGRIHFNYPTEYKNYAASVLAAEQDNQPGSRRVAMFAPRFDGDQGTRLTNFFMASLATSLNQRLSDWEIVQTLAQEAKKAKLLELFQGQGVRAALHLIASHGLQFRHSHPDQLSKQGSILCSDWPGVGKITSDHCLFPNEIPAECDLQGSIIFIFGEFSAGTPKFTNFPNYFSNPRQQMAERDFLAPLSMRLLSLPRAPLAILGHVDTCWAYSISGMKGEIREADFYSFLNLFVDLMRGFPIGAAARHLRDRYNALRAALDALETSTNETPTVNRDAGDQEVIAQNRTIEAQRTATVDARNWIILGDPAVRLMVA